MAASLGPGTDSDLLRRVIVRTWEASQYLAASLEIGSTLEAELFLQCDGGALPDPLRSTFGSLSGPAQALEHLPGDAVAAVAGRLDLGQIVRALFVPGPSGRSAVPAPETDFGWALSMAIASGLGPNLGACLVPSPHAQDGASWPLAWVAGLQTQPLEPRSDQPSLGKGLEPVLRTALGIAAAANRSRNPNSPGRIETIAAQDLTLTRIAGVRLFGAEREFLYALVDDHLLAGSSSEALARVARLPPDESLARQPRLARLLSPRVGEPSQLLFLDLAALRRLLPDAPQAADALATAKHLDPVTAQRSWQELVSLLKLADALLVQARLDAAGLSLAVRAVVDEKM